MNAKWPESPDELRQAYESAVNRCGKSRAIADLARTYAAPVATVRRRLNKAEVRTIRKPVRRPTPEDLRQAYEPLVAEHGKRRATTELARTYGVVYVTVRTWLIEAGLHSVTPQRPRRPITSPCPCGAVAIARYGAEDTPLCYRCYSRTWASDPESPARRIGRETVAAAKKDQPCTDCGGVFPSCVMDFDHVPERGAKLFPLGRSDRSIKALTEEIAKCDVVCANCHRIRTQNRRRSQKNQSAS